MNAIKDRLVTLFFYLAILFFIIGFNVNDTPLSGWYQQFMPNPVGGQVRDITFLDSLTGFAVTDSCILKTTNRGDNWTVKFQGYYIFKRIQFLNPNTGFACGANNKLLKTIDSGENWTIITPSSIYPLDMNVLSEDTIWLVDNNTLVGGVFRTTNGGASWEQQLAPPSDHIYMYNSRIGFISGNGLRKTTDGGANWIFINGAGNFLDMYFADSLTGWKCNLDMKKTTDGGLNWANEIIPSGGNIFDESVLKITKFSGDTIWSVGGSLTVGGSPPNRGILLRTSNGGNIWLFQVPDTVIHINKYFHGQFINNKIGWAYSLAPSGIHTTSGGNDTFFTAVQQIGMEIPQEFALYQNYPNPFNPNTNIKYQIKSNVKREKSNVKLVVYNVLGREITVLVERELSTGVYEVTFDGTKYSSGVYFYSLLVDGKLVDTKKMILIK